MSEASEVIRGDLFAREMYACIWMENQKKNNNK